MIADQTRGPSLEILLTHIRQLTEQPQIIGLSATMSDLGGLDSWLDADVIDVQGRPVPLWEGVVFRAGPSELENMESGERRSGPDLVSAPTSQSVRASDGKLGTAHRILLAEGLSKQTLIFRTQVDATISTAKELAYVLPTDPVDPEVRIRINELEETRVSDFLSQWIDKRVAYHNAGLSLEERRLIEGLFREGIIRVLITTSTLAAGVNTPADVVILLDYKRYDPRHRSNVAIPVTEYKNSVGRAGRFGISSEGHSYLVVDSQNETRLVENHYLHGQAERVRSSMPAVADVGALVLKLLSLGLITSEDELRDSIRRSFAYNHHFQSEDEKDNFLRQFMESLWDLEANDLVQRESAGLSVTDLGKAASASGVSLTSFYELLNVLNAPAMTADSVSDLIPHICKLGEFQARRPYDDDQRVTMLNEWVSGKPISQIIDTYSGRYEIGAGHIRTIGETAFWMLNTAAHIAEVPGLLAEGTAISKGLTELAQRCKFGVPSQVAPIAELRVLHRSELNLLVNNSTGKMLDTFHKILDAKADDFVGILSLQQVERLQTAILDQIGESVSRRRSGHAVRAEKFSGLRPLIEMCYDQQGTDFEIALAQLLNVQYIDLKVNRFVKQRTGQPDLEMTGSLGTIVIQVTASEDDKKPVNWAKAREVLASVGYSGQASNFVTVARPGFHDVAIGNANEMAQRGDQHLLLIPLTELVEVLLSEIEGTTPSGSLLSVLEGERGHFVAEERDDLLRGT